MTTSSSATRGGPIVVAVAQPAGAVGEVTANAERHAEVIEATAARLVVFPELSLTGYDLTAPPLDTTDEAFAAIGDACARRRSVALVGAPIEVGSSVLIATVAVSGTGAALVYGKTFLGDDEAATFVAGSLPPSMELDDRRVGIGVCKDTRIPEHIEAVRAEQVDLYVAGLVHHPHEVGELDARAARLTQRLRVPVAFASAAGRVGPAYPAGAGCSGIWAADGRPLARCGTQAGEVAEALVG